MTIHRGPTHFLPGCHRRSSRRAPAPAEPCCPDLGRPLFQHGSPSPELEERARLLVLSWSHRRPSFHFWFSPPPLQERTGTTPRSWGCVPSMSPCWYRLDQQGTRPAGTPSPAPTLWGAGVSGCVTWDSPSPSPSSSGTLVMTYTEKQQGKLLLECGMVDWSRSLAL